jgi:hypothetical protein
MHSTYTYNVNPLAARIFNFYGVVIVYLFNFLENFSLINLVANLMMRPYFDVRVPIKLLGSLHPF